MVGLINLIVYNNDETMIKRHQSTLKKSNGYSQQNAIKRNHAATHWTAEIFEGPPNISQSLV